MGHVGDVSFPLGTPVPSTSGQYESWYPDLPLVVSTRARVTPTSKVGWEIRPRALSPTEVRPDRDPRSSPPPAVHWSEEVGEGPPSSLDRPTSVRSLLPLRGPYRNSHVLRDPRELFVRNGTSY